MSESWQYIIATAVGLVVFIGLTIFLNKKVKYNTRLPRWTLIICGAVFVSLVSVLLFIYWSKIIYVKILVMVLIAMYAAFVYWISSNRYHSKIHNYKESSVL